MDIFKEFLTAFIPGQSGFFFMWILAGMAFLVMIVAVERLFDLGRQTNIDSNRFVDRLLDLIKNGNITDAIALCQGGGTRALPRVLGSGIKKSVEVPEMATLAMEEESLSVIPRLEKR